MREMRKMKQISSKKQLFINMFATFLNMAINYGINFLFTPYLVAELGSAAYGFVGLANNTVNYATILTISLSSVAGRFVALEIHKGNKKRANEYFNSVISANALFAILFLIVFAVIIANLEKIFDVPDELVVDVKGLFIFISLNFALTIIFNIFNVATFITNRLYLSSLGNCIASVMRVVLLVILFGIFPPYVMYVGLISCVCTIFTAIYNAYLTKKLNVGLVIKLKFFSAARIKELFISGIWSSVTRISQVLSDGLDLVISNLYIGASLMGQLSIAYTIPTLVSSIISSITSLFNPRQTMFYAKGETEGILNEIKLNMKMSGFVTGVVFVCYICFGYDFFKLWTPSADISLVYRLSVLAIASVLVSGITSCLSNVFLITNHLKENSLVWLAVSAFDLIVVLILLNITTWGIYAVAGTSKVVGAIVQLTYTIIYASKCLDVCPKQFYRIFVKYLLSTVCIFIIILTVKKFMPSIDSWFDFAAEICLCGVVGLAGQFFVFLDRTEKIYLISTIKNKVLRK